MKRAFVNPLAPLALLFSLCLVAFLGRLYWLQVAQFEQFALLSSRNFVRTEPIRALRGEVRARDGELLVSNRMATDLVYKGGSVRFFDRIARLAGLEPALPKLEPGKELVLKKNLPEATVIAIGEWAAGQESLELRRRIERIYPQGKTLGNLLGYTQLATDAIEDRDEGYMVDDLKGVAGLEAGLEDLLRGHNGLRFVETDASGNDVGERVDPLPVPGTNVTLTIDLKLQRASEKAIDEAVADINRLARSKGRPSVSVARGAIVAIDPRNGEVLALATGPRYDPNWFSTRPTAPEASLALKDPNIPTWNRAAKLFEPGSTFKLVTSSALLESGFGNHIYGCSTGFDYGGRIWRNWNRVRDMGPMDVREAIAQSCNTWFFKATVEYGPEPFAETLARRAADFGFGEPTGIELIGEGSGRLARTGSLPSPSSFARAGLEWHPGFSLNYAIGQGDMRATPLQIARMLATIVNDGKRPELTVLRRVGDAVTPAKASTQLSGQYWSMLKAGMRQTVVGGTAKAVLGPNVFPIPTGGKTGTAQNPPNPDHAWYMGYGPVDNPTLVVVAMFENGFEGSTVSLPAVKKVMAAYWGIPLDAEGHVIKDEVARGGRE